MATRGMSFTVVFTRCSGWPARRAVLPKSTPHRRYRLRQMLPFAREPNAFNPVVATAIRSVEPFTVAAAPFSSTAPISKPPNQAADPTSTRLRTRVLRCGMCSSESSVCVTQSPMRRFLVHKCHENSEKTPQSFSWQCRGVHVEVAECRSSVTEPALSPSQKMCP